MNQNENLLDLVNAIYRWRKPIILSCFLAAVLSAGVSLLLPNYYKSKTVFYAASPELANPMPTGLSNSERDIYGTDTDLDRLFSIANSSEVVDYLIDTFQLYDRYEIDPNDEKAGYKVRLKLEKMYHTEKNKYDALELSFEDKDPVVAANIARAARMKIEEVGQKIIKNSQLNLLNSYQAAITVKETNQQQLISKLKELKNKYKIYNSTAKGETLGAELTSINGRFMNAKSKLEIFKQKEGFQDSVIVMEAKVAGLKSQLALIQKEADNYSEGSGDVEKLGMEMKEVGEQLALDKESYKQLKASYETPFTALHLVQEAEPPHIKSRPVRSLIVVATTAVTFFMSLLWVIFMNQYRDVNWKKVFSDEPRH